MNARLIVVAVLFMLVCLGNLQGRLLDIYKKGVIKVIADPNFGKNTDWESLIYDSSRSLLVVPDGSVFVANANTHNFYKFAANGAHIGTYSRKGAGPQDLYSPTLTSCLDGKYLVLNDYPLSRKINLFDFNGKYVAALRTKDYCFHATGLKNGLIAYYSHKEKPMKNDGKSVTTIYIHILDMNTRAEKSFMLGDISAPVIQMSSMYHIRPGSFLGDFNILQTRDGNLLTGFSNSPDLKIFDPNGILIRTIHLKLSPILVTRTYIENAKKDVIQGFQNDVKSEELSKRIRKAVEKANFNPFFGKYLPYYESLMIDAEGNLLVFKMSESFGKANETFQVYSSSGDFICETILDNGEFDIQINSSGSNIQFAKDALYGILESDDENGDPMTRLIKIKY